MVDEEEQQEESGGGKKKLFMLIGIGVLLVALSIGGTVAVLMFLKDDPEPVAEEGAPSEEDAEVEEVKQPAIYFAIKPPLLLTYSDQGRQRYAQVEMSIMARSETVISETELHNSRIRNDLIMAFSGLEFHEVQTPEGKELMRQQALETVQTILTEEMGEPGIEQVLFTNLVMQ